MKGALTLNRKGIFVLEKPAKENGCYNDFHKVFNYAVRIKCKPKLDDKGFIIKHEYIDMLVQKTKAGSSCEKMCIQIAERLAYYLRKHGAKVKSVYVRVYPELRPVEKVVSFMEYKLKIKNYHKQFKPKTK